VVELVDGIVPEYAPAAHRYYGSSKGQIWLDKLNQPDFKMAWLTVTPEWVELLDFKELFPFMDWDTE